jgi:hypothetical protein
MAHNSDGDSATLSDERLILVRRALQRIAADHELTASGHRKKLTRHQAVNLAREICQMLGWDYSRHHKDP